MCRLGVTPGLDTGVHDERPRATQSYVSFLDPKRLMDCRVKPSNDGYERR